MSYPPFVLLSTEDEYRSHFEAVYCRGPIVTFDGIEVRFRKEDFDHCFYEADDSFSRKRAERIDWIKAALLDPTAEKYVGWDNKRKRYDMCRRVAVAQNNYVVVIVTTKANKARFITAYVADTPSRPGRLSTVDLIRRGPKWA